MLDSTDYENYIFSSVPPHIRPMRRLAIAVLARAAKDMDDLRWGVIMDKPSKAPLLRWVRDSEKGIADDGSLIFWAHIAFEKDQADYFIKKFRRYYREHFNS